MSIAGDLCFAGIGEKIYVWQVSSGCLFAVLEACFQPVSILKVNPVGDVLAAGSEDGSVTFWSIKSLSRELCSSSQTESPDPIAAFTSHSSAVTDISFVSRDNSSSTSRDGKCCVYDLARKRVVLQIAFDEPLHSVAMDRAKYLLFVGSESGEIHETRMFEKIESVITSRSSSGTDGAVSASSFVGHSQKVTCLDVTVDGLGLVSGSADGSVRLWNIQSKQCMRCTVLKEPVGSAQIFTFPHTTDSSRNAIIAHKFDRTTKQMTLNQSAVMPALHQVNGHSHHDADLLQSRDSKRRSKATDAGLQIELEKQKKVNRELYNMFVRKGMASAFTKK